MKKLLLILAFIPALLFSQTRKQRKALEAQRKADQQIINNLKSHGQILANKNLSSVSGSQAATEYIINQFKTIGLKPKGTDSYIQPFKIDDGKQIKTGTFLKVNGTVLAVKKDYFPLSYSAQKAVTGMPAMALKEKGVPWFTDVKDWLEDTAKNEAFDINKIVQKEAERAASKGATALFLYNSSNITDHLYFNNKSKETSSLIPIVYITPEGHKKYFNDQSSILDIELNVAFEASIKNANNIVGYLDNGASSNIIVAAPYNMYQEDSAYSNNGKKANDTLDIVNGPSMLIELARMLIASKAKNNNYTFIAYSGQNMVSQDSRWISGAAITSSINYIINLNNVGRYDDDKKLIIEDYGTPLTWKETIKSVTDKALEISFDSSNLKDTSLYYVRAPLLNFFTDHNNYPGASVIADKINYDEELQIAKFILRIIEATDTKGKLAFAENNKPHLPELQAPQPATSSQKTPRP